MRCRIALIHATPLAIAPINTAFSELWSETTLMNVLDDSLSTDLSAAGQLEAPMTQRFRQLSAYAVSTGADAIIFTCSAFGTAIDSVRIDTGIPVLKPNEAMFRQALDIACSKSGRIGLLTTFAPAAAPMQQEFQAEVIRRGSRAELQQAFVPGALQALQAGRLDEHDELVARAAGSLAGCDVLMLGQFSMARAQRAAEVEVGGATVLTSPHSAVHEVRRQLGLRQADI